MEVALLRGLDVERLLLDDERGRDERCARLLDHCRRGLRWMESGRLSGRREPERWRWDLERRCEGGYEGGNSTGGRGWLGAGGEVGSGGVSDGGGWLVVRSWFFSSGGRRGAGGSTLIPYPREAFGWLSSWISPPALTVLFILWWRSPGSRQLDPYHTHRREAFGWLSSRISPPALTVLPKSDGSSSAARSRCGTSPSWWWTWSRRAVRSSFGSLSTRTAMDGEWTFVRSTGARAVAMRSEATMWGWIWRWKFNWWERMAGSWWRSWKWWSVRWWRVTGGALLVLLRKGLHSGFDRMFHLLHHLFWIEGYTGTRLCGCRCHGSWWFWRLGCGMRWRWSGRRLMEWEELLKMLDVGLSLRRQLLVQDGILLPEMSKLCLSLSLRLSLRLLVHYITSTKLTLKSHRLRSPSKIPHWHRDVGKTSRKHGSTVRRLNWKQPSSKQMHPHKRAVFPSLGSMARVQVTTLWTAYVFNPWITCTISTSPRNQKRSDHTWKACPEA